MTDAGLFCLAVGIFMFGIAIDNGLTNIAKAISKRKDDK